MNHIGIYLAIAVPLVFVGATYDTEASPSPGLHERPESPAGANGSGTMMDGGGALIDSICVRTGVTLGQCGDARGLLPECDSNWLNACSNAGGSPSSCSGGACSSEVIKCQDGDDLLHACDEAFITSCEIDELGDFECTTSTCCPSNCTHGKCSIPT